ncbi:hypothetical protein [Actinomadura geliboluensis]|uniref:Uncharacterized protein n=1 Tax=Actinomadura geliboluensis TaxID=882440 RepID=A0A5S4HBG4_9ACTN|nr:hypothetical protein [Actinomadura geliboluensis]TMR42319.1 hypothetical protein ETD96_01130 [Actinomadura geliboluensis]
MFHHDIMRSVMTERSRELRTRAAAERDARLARRAREFWAERAERFGTRREVRRDVRGARRQGAAPAR